MKIMCIVVLIQNTYETSSNDDVLDFGVILWRQDDPTQMRRNSILWNLLVFYCFLCWWGTFLCLKLIHILPSNPTFSDSTTSKQEWSGQSAIYCDYNDRHG